MKSLACLFIAAALLYAADPWTKDPQKWTTDDAQRILNASPWAQQARATFAAADDNEPPPPGPLPGAAQAGMAGQRGATDGNWDGGVGRRSMGVIPTLQVLVRWDTALPIREATMRIGDVRPVDNDVVAKNYVVTLFGLVPAKRYRDAGKLDTSSSSDDTVDARDPEDLLEGLMATSRLVRHGHPQLAPDNVKLDGATGILHIFFPRTDPIRPAEKDVLFHTRFGSVTVEKEFHLREMTYQGRLEL